MGAGWDDWKRTAWGAGQQQPRQETNKKAEQGPDACKQMNTAACCQQWTHQRHSMHLLAIECFSHMHSKQSRAKTRKAHR